MRTTTKFLSTFVLTVALVFVGSTAYGQLEEMEYPENAYWDLNINSGVLVAQNDLFTTGLAVEEGIFDDDSDARGTFELGADLSYRLENGVTFGGQFAWSPIQRDLNEETLFGQTFQQDPGLTRDMNMYLYSGSIGYAATMGRLGVNASVGLGAITQSFDTGEIENFLEENPGVDVGIDDIFNETDSETNWQTPLTVGAQYAISRNVSINAMARDYIVYGDEFNDASNNFYFGGGVSFLF